MTMDRTVLGRLLGASSRRSRSAGAAIMTETRLSKGDGHLRCSPEAIAVPVLVEVDATKESLKVQRWRRAIRSNALEPARRQRYS